MEAFVQNLQRARRFRRRWDHDDEQEEFVRTLPCARRFLTRGGGGGGGGGGAHSDADTGEEEDKEASDKEEEEEEPLHYFLRRQVRMGAGRYTARNTGHSILVRQRASRVYTACTILNKLPFLLLLRESRLARVRF